MVRRTESWEGVAEVHAIKVEGELLEPPAWPVRKMLFIGDSITCGEYVDRLPPDYQNGRNTANANGSFGMELGRRLGAQVHLVSYGGRGLVRDWQGNDAQKTATAPVFFERALPDDPQTKWDHASWQPDVVVVGLGTNDFNQGIPDEQMWVAAYEKFAARIREVYPQAWIILTGSAIFSSRVEGGDAAKTAAINHYLDETIARRMAAGDQKMEKAHFRYQPGTPGNGHPNGPQHMQMADDLEGLIRMRLGWR